MSKNDANCFSVSNIQWDDAEGASLPNTLIIHVPSGEDAEEYISEVLSDFFGFCHRGFCFCEVENA